jgi:hypothetical protein
MRYAIIEAGVVTNVVLASEPLGANWIETEAAGPGWLYQDDEFIDPNPVVPFVPQSITFAQLLIGLVTEAWITEAEGEAWLTGVLPTQVTALIDTLPVEQRFAARARATRPSEVLRMDSFVVSMGAAQGKTPEELDDFFRIYSGV